MAVPDAVSSARGGPSTHRAPARIVAGAPAVVKRNAGGAAAQNLYMPFTLIWLPLVVVRERPLVESSLSCIHSRPSA